VRRIFHDQRHKVGLVAGQSLKHVVLYGAGRAGIMLQEELAHHADVEIVGFVDDNPRKVGTIISGIRVLGHWRVAGEGGSSVRVDEVVISIAATSTKALTQILAKCKAIPVRTQIIPTLQEIVEGRVTIGQVREVRVEDLLGRGSVTIGEFSDDVINAYQGKRILVTGAADRSEVN